VALEGEFVQELSDKAIDTDLEHAVNGPSDLSLMHLYPIYGAVHQLKANETACGHRDTRWSMIIAGIDPDPAQASALKT
jgi:hypothetical protein